MTRVISAPLPKAAKGERPFSLMDADHERLLNMIVALTAVISVLQDQQDMLTRILVARGVDTDEDIAYFHHDTAPFAARATQSSEESRIGKECVSQGSPRQEPYYKKTTTTHNK